MVKGAQRFWPYLDYGQILSSNISKNCHGCVIGLGACLSLRDHEKRVTWRGEFMSALRNLPLDFEIEWNILKAAKSTPYLF